MSDIDAPNNLPLRTGEGTPRVTRTTPTSDENSPQQQSSGKHSPAPQKVTEVKERGPAHETAVTLSPNLSNLDVGARLTAQYKGLDGAERPLLETANATYVVKYDAAQAGDITKFPREAQVEILVTRVDRKIEARLSYTDPAQKSARRTELPHPVTLELTRLGNQPPQLRPSEAHIRLPQEQPSISYQASSLFMAEHIAQESASKLNALPLPTSTTNYTLFEKAVPDPQWMHKEQSRVTQSSIAGNALIAQEQRSAEITTAAPARAAGASTDRLAASAAIPAAGEVAPLLHKDIIATVVKHAPPQQTRPAPGARQHLEVKGPLDQLDVGKSFTLRLDSIAVPDARPEAAMGDRAAQPHTPAPAPAEAIASTAKTYPAEQIISGIIIDPGQKLRAAAEQIAAPQTGERTLYAATPVSVVKFQSPVDLKPGTIINFTLPPQAQTPLAAAEILVQPPLQNGAEVTAQYLGSDGKTRILLELQEKTYVIKSDPALQSEVSKITPGAPLEIKIIQTSPEILARISYQDTRHTPAEKVTLQQPVILQPTALPTSGGVETTTAGAQQPILKTSQGSVQANDLFLAGRVALENTKAINPIPIPEANTPYTLYQKTPLNPQSKSAFPQGETPSGFMQSSITGSSLLAQEQATAIAKAADGIPKAANTIAPPTEGVTPPQKVRPDVSPLLHQEILATVIKSIPRAPIDLPAFVTKHMQSTGPLDHFAVGHNFNLRVESLAIPEKNLPPGNTPPPQQAQKNVMANVSTTATARPPDNGPILSGIIIDPGQKLLDNATAFPQPRHVNRYAENYGPTLSATAVPQNEPKTLYVATPVSVIKIQSPVALDPGTVINFSLPTSANAALPADQAQATALQNKDQPSDVPRESVSHSASQGAAGHAATTVASSGASSASPSDSTIATAAAQASSGTIAAPLPPQPLTELIGNWHALSQLVSLIPTAEAAEASRAMMSRVPTIQSPAQMTSTMIFFMAAMGAQNPARTWLGPQVTQHLEKNGHSNLLKALDHDMQQISRLAAATPSGEWRPALIPLQVGGEVTAIPILTRQVIDEEEQKKKQSGEDGDTEKVTATRFIVEVTLSQLGTLQVDGMLSQQRLNMIIRTPTSLPAALKQKVSELFTTALEISGFTGDIQYRDATPLKQSVQDIMTQKIHLSQRSSPL